MVWPYDELKKYPGLTTDEWDIAVIRANPDGGLLEQYQHQANSTGTGPEGRWNVEVRGFDPANLRMMTVSLPYGFPRITAETLFTDGHVVCIGGLAAPSSYGRSLIEAGKYGEIRAMISFLGSVPDGMPFPYTNIHWQDYTANDQSLELALKAAGSKLEEHRDSTSKPTVFFHCAWGVGRTGTALAIYKMMGIVMENRHKKECQNYFTQPRIKDSEIIIHHDDGENKKVLTTPLVALAINHIRRTNSTPMVAVEYESQIRLIERYEENMALAMSNHLGYRYIPAQEGSLGFGLMKTVARTYSEYRQRSLPQYVPTDQVTADHFGKPKALAEPVAKPKALAKKGTIDAFKRWLRGGVHEETGDDKKPGERPPTKPRH